MSTSRSDKPFEVVTYSRDCLVNLLSDESEAPREVIDGKSHITYLDGYLRLLGVRTIVVEHEYTDRDFLEDFAGYYVRCFHEYRSKCVRLHFFSGEFSGESLSGVLAGRCDPALSSILRGGYLGFMVVKPLPQTVIGRTCLKAYPEHDRRSLPITRSYRANLFGIPLEVEKSLPFQEQDTVAAACATSALWSIFQGTSRLFHHPVPSPVEITKAATAVFPGSQPNLPSRGLNRSQMAHAIRSVGLEPVPLDIGNLFQLQSTIYAYLKGGIPVLLGVQLLDYSTQPPKLKGEHAVAVTGFRFKRTGPTACQGNGFLLRASRMHRLFAHDDAVGPFARMGLHQKHMHYEVGKETYCLLSTMWRTSDHRVGRIWARPEYLLIPVYHKIRIPFSLVLAAVTGFDEYIELLRKDDLLPLAGRLEWDIYLTTVNDVKTEIAATDGVGICDREAVLLQPMPRYIWRATGSYGEAKVLDLLFDATDIEQGAFFVRAVEYDPGLAVVLRSALSVPGLISKPRTHLVYSIFQWFAEQPMIESQDLDWK